MSMPRLFAEAILKGALTEPAPELAALGVEVEVVNGITAGLAVPATLGIPLTHRDHVHGVTFVSGHTHQGDERREIFAAISHLEEVGLGLQAVFTADVANQRQDEEVIRSG